MQLPQQGKIFAITIEEAAASPDVVTGTVNIAGVPTRVLFNSEATHSFVSMSFGKRMELPIKKRKLIFFALKAKRCLEKGGMRYLVSVVDIIAEVPKMEDLVVVREFSDVFPEDLPGLPPDRATEFVIDLMLGSVPVSKAPYRMAPTELKELKT
ncbi:hypothetical protein NE237_028951 [Protea cynaroides]|uniref:Uncharacterized protein n=1 Tax=Protea cynaroides TaxID=273540 RepID=A0A9Q0GUV8_9MAGN|nr:hypothetical protein NE237_028951 [Protea cynaroides]